MPGATFARNADTKSRPLRGNRMLAGPSLLGREANPHWAAMQIEAGTRGEFERAIAGPIAKPLATLLGAAQPVGPTSVAPLPPRLAGEVAS